MNECVLSVVIPAFNPGPLLEEQLAALAAQRVDVPWEVVIADNGSTDGSLATVDRYAESMSIRVIDASDKRGPSHARNRGAASAAGDWIAFCDSDDVAAPDWLSRLWAHRDEGDIVCGAWDVTLLNAPWELKARGGPDFGTELPEGPCGFLSFAPSCSVLMSRALFESLDGWDETLPHGEDVDLSWRAQLNGATLAFAADSVMHYRYRSSFRATFRQLRGYKFGETALYRRYRSVGARRPSLAQVLGRYWWVVSRSPYLLMDRERKNVWVAIAATVVGRAQGSFRHRVVYL